MSGKLGERGALRQAHCANGAVRGERQAARGKQNVRARAARTGGTLLRRRFMNCACSLTYAIVVSSTMTPYGPRGSCFWNTGIAHFQKSDPAMGWPAPIAFSTLS